MEKLEDASGVGPAGQFPEASGPTGTHIKKTSRNVEGQKLCLLNPAEEEYCLRLEIYSKPLPP